MKRPDDPFIFLQLALAEYTRRSAEEETIKSLQDAEDIIAEALVDLALPEVTSSCGAQLDRLVSIAATALQAANQLVLGGVTNAEIEATFHDYGIALQDSVEKVDWSVLR